MDESYYYGIAATGIVGALTMLLFCRSKRKTTKINLDHQAPLKVIEKLSQSNVPAQLQKSGQEIKKQQKLKQVVVVKKLEELQTEYQGLFIGSFRLRAANSIHAISALDFKGSKLLIATTKNEMILFSLKNWKKEAKNSAPEKHFVSLDNNGASAVCIGEKYYYVALTFDKTIAYYEYQGQHGVYFRQVAKFARNILKSNAIAIHVPKSQNFIITVGSGADTVMDVWSMKGEKLQNINSFQIEHYGISCGSKDILIRGWTSQIKIFGILEQKDGSFKKLQKRQHLAHEESPLASAICNRDMFAMSISKHHKVKVWPLYTNDYHRSNQSTVETHPQFSALQVSKCSIYTFQPAVGHFKTIIVISHSNGFILTDTSLKILHKIDGIDVKDIYMNGTQKSIILGVVNNQGLILLWNLTKQIENVQEVTV